MPFRKYCEKSNSTKKKKKKYMYFVQFNRKLKFNLGSWCTQTWHVPCNRSRPRELAPCRRLIERRKAAMARDGTAGEASARPPKGLNIDRLQRLENNRDGSKPTFRRPAPRKLQDQLPHHDFAQSFDRNTPVAAASVGRWGGASPSKKSLEP